MDIKEVLMSGEATAEELLKQFKEQLTAAQKEVDKAKKEKEEKLKAAAEEEMSFVRKSLVLSIVDYLDMLGLIKEEDLNDEDYDKLCDAFKDAEQSLKNYTKVLEMVGGKPSENAIIADFLKTIM